MGLEGPDADKAAYDIAGYWARSGLAGLLTSPGHHPPFQRGGMGDHTAGQSLAGGIAAALFHRERTGEGQLVMTSLLRQGLYTISFDLSVAVRYGIGLGVANRAAMGNPCVNNYCDRDGKWFWIVGLEGDRHWPPLARAVGHPEWLDDPRFSTLAGSRGITPARSSPSSTASSRRARAKTGGKYLTPSTTSGGRPCSRSTR